MRHLTFNFKLHMLPLGQILQNSNINYHSYADDTQVYVSLSPDNYSPIDTLCLFLDPKFSTIKWGQNWDYFGFFATKRRRLVSATTLGPGLLKTKDQVHNLGLIWPSPAILKLSPKQLKSINRTKSFLSQKDQEKLIHAFISSKIDYCNGFLTGLPKVVFWLPTE